MRTISLKRSTGACTERQWFASLHHSHRYPLHSESEVFEWPQHPLYTSPDQFRLVLLRDNLVVISSNTDTDRTLNTSETLQNPQ